ncbi:MAG: T9SS type A sorting domain-containing protein [Flavobacteriales bacterium]|nr:T9SS type A sorting domain-containing protein [Flavobacteriales bacterium]
MMRATFFLVLSAMLPAAAQAQSLDRFIPIDLDVPINGVFPTLTIAALDSGPVAVFGPEGTITSWSSQRLGDLGWRSFDATGLPIGGFTLPATAGVSDMVPYGTSFYAVGPYKDSLQFPGHPQLSTAGQLDPIGYYLCRIELDGTVSWVKDAEDIGLGSTQAIAVGPGGVLHLGAWDFINSVVVRVDSNGTLIDTWPLAGVGVVSDIAVNASGNVAVAGSCMDLVSDFNGTTITNPFTYTIFLARFDANGSAQHHQIVEDVTCPRPSVALDDAGNAYLSADASIPAQVGPFTVTDPAWVYGEFLVQMDASGTITWLNEPVPGLSLGDAGRAYGRDLVLDPSGGVWQGGLARGMNDWGNGITSATAVPGQQLYFRRVDANGLTQQFVAGDESNFGQTVHSLATQGGTALYMLGYAYDTLHLAGMEFPAQGYQLFLTRWSDLNTGIPVSDVTPSLRVFPNPASDQITIDLSTLEGTVSLEVFDVQGRVVVQNQSRGGVLCVMELSGLRSGVYLLHVQGEGRRSVLPIMKE